LADEAWHTSCSLATLLTPVVADAVVEGAARVKLVLLRVKAGLADTFGILRPTTLRLLTKLEPGLDSLLPAKSEMWKQEKKGIFYQKNQLFNLNTVEDFTDRCEKYKFYIMYFRYVIIFSCQV